jgi:hypothetical protein
MPAIIRVTSGPGGGREFWIESPVVRIGSHPDSDLCLPSPAIAPHAITIEFRNKQYVVHNRSEQPFLIGTQSVEKQTKAEWANGQQLEFPGIAVLTLLLDRDPTPGAKPHSSDMEPLVVTEPDVEEHTDEDTAVVKNSSFSPKEMIQLAVTIGCVLGIVVIIASKVIPQKPNEKIAKTVTFEEVLEDRKKVSDPVFLSMINEVQEAKVLKSKGDSALAIHKLTRVRNQLHERRNGEGQLAQQHEQRLYDYVATQMSGE